MRLRITTPFAVLIQENDVVGLRAEDSTGSFGILLGHADFLTSLAVSVVSWIRADGSSGHCAVRRGILTVSGGSEIGIATREAVSGADLERLGASVLAHLRTSEDEERVARTESMRLHMQAVREMIRQLGAASRPRALP